MARISRRTVQRATRTPSCRNCRHTLRGPYTLGASWTK